MMFLTENERDIALMLYSHGWSYQEIASQILFVRSAMMERDVIKEVGRLCAASVGRRAQPEAFYYDSNCALKRIEYRKEGKE